jgi:type I restriction enzyme S subunit
MFKACRLEDIVYVVTDKTSSEKDEMLPYVGLEHLRQRGGGLKGWSPATNSISINTIFKAGDVLFGKLRPNLRKSALAPFDGYCSTDILVLRPKEGISSRFAAKVFQSERVGAAAEMTAAGTKMPRTSWNALRALEVYCPAIESQESLADVLDTLDTTIRRTEMIIEKLNLVKHGLLHDLLTRGIDTNGELRSPQIQGPHLYKDSPLGRVPNEWTVELLDSVAARGSGHTPSKSTASYWNGGIKWVSLSDSHRLDQIYITETDKEISELGLANSSAVKHQAGTVILSRDAGVGKSAVLAGEMAVSQHFIAWLCGQKLNNLYLYYMFQHMKPTFESIAIGSTIKTIGLGFFKKLQIVVPPRAEQDRIVEIILSNEAGLQTHSEELAKLRLQKKGLMDDLLSGRIPVTPLLETAGA